MQDSTILQGTPPPIGFQLERNREGEEENHIEERNHSTVPPSMKLPLGAVPRASIGCQVLGSSLLTHGKVCALLGEPAPDPYSLSLSVVVSSLCIHK